MLPDMAASISASVGLGLLVSIAEADMICPDLQYPHCTTSRSSHAFWIFAPAGVSPIASIVVIAESPTLSTGVMQERMGVPFICTVQAPQSARPQPNFVPVIPSTSRSTQSSGVSPSTSTSWSVSLTLIVKATDDSPGGRSAALLPVILPIMSKLLGLWKPNFCRCQSSY